MQFLILLFFMFFFFYRIKNQNSDIEYKEISNSFSDDTNRGFPMQNHRPRREHVLEAQIQDGDTLQAIALRFNCTVGFFP